MLCEVSRVEVFFRCVFQMFQEREVSQLMYARCERLVKTDFIISLSCTIVPSRSFLQSREYNTVAPKRLMT